MIDRSKFHRSRAKGQNTDSIRSASFSNGQATPRGGGSVAASNAGSAGVGVNGIGLFFSKGSSNTFLGGQRRTLPLPTRRKGVPSIVLDTPFRAIVTLTGSINGIGGDRPLQLLPEVDGGGPVTFLSTGRARDAYTIGFLFFSAGEIQVVGQKNISRTATPVSFLRALDFASTGTTVSDSLPVTGEIFDKNQATLSGDPEDINIGYSWVGHDFSDEFFVNDDYPASYSAFPDGTSAYREYNWAPGFTAIPGDAVVTENYRKETNSDNFIGAPSAAPRSNSNSCNQTPGQQNEALPAWSGTGGYPGRRVETTNEDRFSWTIDTVEPISFYDGATQTGSYSSNFSFSRDSISFAQINPGPVAYSSFCANIGVISNVFRVFFGGVEENITLSGGATTTEDTTYSQSREMALLPGITKTSTHSYSRNFSEGWDGPSNAALVDVPRNTSETITETLLQYFLGIYDDDGTSLLFTKATKTRSLNRNLSVTSRTFGVSFLFNSGHIPAVGTNADFTGTATDVASRSSGQYDDTIIETIELFFRTTTQEINLGTLLSIPAATPKAPLIGMSVGDIVETESVRFGTGRSRTQSYSIPVSGGIPPFIYTHIDFTSEVLGRTFYHFLQDTNDLTLFHVYRLTGVGVVPVSGGIPLEEDDDSFAEIRLRIEEIKTTKAPPLGAGRIRRFDHAADLVRFSNTTIRRSTESGVLWDLFFTSRPRDTTVTQKHYYTRGQLLQNGAVTWDLEDIEGDYVGHDGFAQLIRVNP